MLNIYLGEMEGAVYHPPVYFDNRYEDEWLAEPLAIEMVKDVDKSEIIVWRRFMACIPLENIRTPGGCIKSYTESIRSQQGIFGSRINCWWRIPTLAMNSLRL